MNRELQPKRKQERKNSKKRICPICRTTKFRATEDGVVCRYGHKLLGVQIEVQEEFANAGTRERKRVKKDVDEETRTPPAKLHSDHMRIIQFALQVFGRCLVEDLNFPPELEFTIRELWFLCLGSSKRELYEAYIYESNDNDLHEVKIKQAAALKFEEEERELDSNLPSSDSEPEEDTVTVKGKKQVKYRWPSLNYADTLVFIYLACIYLNYPLLLNDLHRWSSTNKLPYLTMQHRIPTSILSQEERFFETMTIVPTLDHLIARTYLYQLAFTNSCKLKFPPLNIPLYLERFCSQFYLPVQGYYYAEYLFNLYSKNKVISFSPTQNTNTSAVTIAMACVLAAVKIIYSINGSEADSDHISKHNTDITKASWLKNVRENIKRWNDVKEVSDELDLLIQFLQDSAVAYRVNANDVDKQNIVAGLLGQVESRSRRLPAARMPGNLFMEPAELNTDLKNEIPEAIQEGRFYYKAAGTIKQEDYLDILKLATLIIGRSTDPVVEEVLLNLDAMLMKSQKSKIQLQDIYQYYYDKTRNLNKKGLIRKL